jgi:hypothetical protein
MKSSKSSLLSIDDVMRAKKTIVKFVPIQSLQELLRYFSSPSKASMIASSTSVTPHVLELFGHPNSDLSIRLMRFI